MVVVSIESTEEFDGYLKNSGDKLIVVDFTAVWCGPCKTMAPIFEELSNNAAYADVIFLKVDVDKCEEVSTKSGVQCMPTFHFYRNGSRVDYFSGANQATLKKKLAELTSA
ncbi:thioredoxin b isoform X1 [Hippocampus comes]|uniref:Thioredoxin n=1 Tax=Hippocampus comes TaxID=109280 RepID=A0A3Q2Y6G0_HIPCM|nr:PREDICTED: thioredoxin isoform X1 [Hippocampus comes]